VATTVNLLQTAQGDSNRRYNIDLTAGGADTSVTVTLPVIATNTPLPIYGVSTVNVTTGAVNSASTTYNATTAVLTIVCANSDRVRACVFF
jgi:hypothetical protein